MNLASKAIRKYKQEGISGLLIGGISMLIRQLERNTIAKTRFEIPYFVYKCDKKSKKAMNTLSDRGVGPRITEVPLSDHKSSEKLFILGSGSSITDISDTQWDHIDEHDSFGLNRWPVHEFTPTYYTFEIRLDQSKKQFREAFWELLEARRKQYEDVPIILKDTTVISTELEPRHLPDWLAGNLIVSCDSNYSRLVRWDSTVEQNKELLEHLNSKGYFDQRSGIRTLYRKRGSISYIIHLGVLLGYEEIILCGVDMVDSKYFFDGDSYNRADIPIPRFASNTNDESEETVHKTNDPNVGNLTLEKVIYSLNDIVLEPKGIDLYVENEKSALHPKIPVYQYEQ